MDDNRITVYIIDDNEMARSLLHMIVQGEQFNVIGSAAGAASGLAGALALRPDIVCLDIQMPDGDGLDLLETFSRRLPRTVVLMVTACNDVTSVQAAFKRGAKGFILKPFTSGTVLDKLETAAKLLAAPSGGGARG
ncbi:response regulator [Massilia sp. TWR1-2-2]|uniref:response regulator n=1 Tax=Massilia sp. TWR1-2-2 TaxID=2804584 RepID=UPI003CE7EF60